MQYRREIDVKFKLAVGSMLGVFLRRVAILREVKAAYTRKHIYMLLDIMSTSKFMITSL